jgi:cytoskeletal protein RodZ
VHATNSVKAFLLCLLLLQHVLVRDLLRHTEAVLVHATADQQEEAAAARKQLADLIAQRSSSTTTAAADTTITAATATSTTTAAAAADSADAGSNSATIDATATTNATATDSTPATAAAGGEQTRGERMLRQLLDASGYYSAIAVDDDVDIHVSMLASQAMFRYTQCTESTCGSCMQSLLPCLAQCSASRWVFISCSVAY